MLSRKPDIACIPTPPEAVDAALMLAGVGQHDRLYDLGSGDGRVVIRAAQRFGTRGVGIDIDPERIRQAEAAAAQAGVGDRVQFRQQDLFECDVHEATVVFLYLLPHLNLRLRPMLLKQLQPGSRVVSRDFDMGDWACDRSVYVAGEEECTLYLWRC
jgi:ubiquinone/menaquinone biosynthesis C-methylase UbiE